MLLSKRNIFSHQHLTCSLKYLAVQQNNAQKKCFYPGGVEEISKEIKCDSLSICVTFNIWNSLGDFSSWGWACHWLQLDARPVYIAECTGESQQKPLGSAKHVVSTCFEAWHPDQNSQLQDKIKQNFFWRKFLYHVLHKCCIIPVINVSTLSTHQILANYLKGCWQTSEGSRGLILMVIIILLTRETEHCLDHTLQEVISPGEHRPLVFLNSQIQIKAVSHADHQDFSVMFC